MRILITGANRGLGLEIVRQYLHQEDTQIVATCRSPQSAHQLNELAAQAPGRVWVQPMEVTDAETIAAAVKFTTEQCGALEVLINNAGINPPNQQQSFPNLDAEILAQTFQVNTIAPLMIARAFTPLLLKGQAPRIANISTQMGSITDKNSGGSYAYGASKAALNFVTRALANDLKAQNVLTVDIHPGWVQTDMGGPNASLTPQQSVEGVIALIDKLTQEQSGYFFKWNGESHPW